ncbi:hypothetical protein M0802_004443 [Mischocyttarus mexicanus]|nr:hypothetical protein M0802_004443 [Mischocyttarus mexicanus]
MILRTTTGNGGDTLVILSLRGMKRIGIGSVDGLKLASRTNQEEEIDLDSIPLTVNQPRYLTTHIGRQGEHKGQEAGDEVCGWLREEGMMGYEAPAKFFQPGLTKGCGWNLR